MAVPQKKISKSRKNKRRSHHGLGGTSLGRCPRCNQAVKPHEICGNCGYYRGRRQVIDREGL
jgi:large subunit ribosomal protein L32